MLPIGLFFVAFPLLGHLSVSHRAIAGAGLLIAFMGVIIATKQLHGFYDRRYGKVELSEKNWFPGVGMGIWAVIFLRCIIIDGLHPHFSLAVLWMAGFFGGFT